MRRAILILGVVTFVLALATPATADHIPRTGDYLSVYSPPETFPANAPFWVGSAFGTSLDNKVVVLNPGTKILLFVDGRSSPMLVDITFTEDSISKLCLHNFRFGLSTGIHHFEEDWYLQGVFQYGASADISFE